MKRLTTPELSFGVPSTLSGRIQNAENIKAKVTFKQGNTIVFTKEYVKEENVVDANNSLVFVEKANKFVTVLTEGDTGLLSPGVVKMELALKIENEVQISDIMTANVEEVLLTGW